MGQKGLDEKVRSVAGENGEAERSAIWWRRLIYNSMAWLVVQCGTSVMVSNRLYVMVLHNWFNAGWHRICGILW